MQEHNTERLNDLSNLKNRIEEDFQKGIDYAPPSGGSADTQHSSKANILHAEGFSIWNLASGIY
jgi:hypothetical protein